MTPKLKEKGIQEIIIENRDKVQTPYYLIDESLLVRNLEKIKQIKEKSGAKCVLALKCFSTWSVFPLMSQYMDGTTSSSLYEAKLGAEKFGKEVHAYSVAFSDEDIKEASRFATKFIFNSVSQLKRFYPQVKHLKVGLRINPGISHSDFDLADPSRRHCRLGTVNPKDIEEVQNLLSGVMFHCNCENDDLESFGRILDHISRNFGPLLQKLEWVSLGGGIYFTKENYPLDAFCKKLADFSKEFNVQVYLEPGEAAISHAAYMVTKVLDIVHNERDIAVVDAAVEPHMLDLLIYRTPAKLELAADGVHEYDVAGRTCLAGDVFGTYKFPQKLQVGDLIPFSDAAGYTMVKKNWFNGVQMPSIVVRRLNGKVEVVRQFHFDDFLNSLS